jgi:hypothetical protein
MRANRTITGRDLVNVLHLTNYALNFGSDTNATTNTRLEIM